MEVESRVRKMNDVSKQEKQFRRAYILSYRVLLGLWTKILGMGSSLIDEDEEQGMGLGRWVCCVEFFKGLDFDR